MKKYILGSVVYFVLFCFMLIWSWQHSILSGVHSKHPHLLVCHLSVSGLSVCGPSSSWKPSFCGSSVFIWNHSFFFLKLCIKLGIIKVDKVTHSKFWNKIVKKYLRNLSFQFCDSFLNVRKKYEKSLECCHIWEKSESRD